MGAERTQSHADTVVYAEDVRAGDVFELGSYTVTEAELVSFASQWDPQTFHTDRQVAANGYFGGLIASGVHTLAVYQRLTVLGVLSRWSVIAGRTMRQVEFLRPVRAGDTLTGTLTVDAVELDDRGRGLVTSTGQLVNGAGTPVLRVVVEAYLRRS